MKKIILHQIALLMAALTLSASAWATLPATSPYVTDPQNEYVQDATSDAIGSLNMVLCIMGAMDISGSSMVNVGPYIALVDMNKCQSKGSSSGSTGGSSGASAAVNYMTAVVNATRASSTAPMVADIWMSMTEMGMVTNVYVKVTATQSPTDVPPYGVFRMDYIGKVGGVTQFNGFINATASGLQFYETGSNSSNVALAMAAGSTTSGSGTMTVANPSPATYDFNYNSTNFLRGTECFDRTKANANRSVWRLGTYNAADGSRVDQTHPSFQITASYGSSSYYGYAGYYGIGFQGLDLNSIPDASPISGLVVTDQRPGNTTTYSLSKVSGKLTKWAQNATTLAAMDGIPFTFSGDLTGLTTGNTAVTSWGNWQMQWNSAAANFTVTGMQSCGMSGCTLATITPVATVSPNAFNNMSISGWSDSFGGNLNIPFTTLPHTSADAVNYYSQSTVIPGDPSAPAALYCLNNCPDATSVATANAYTSGMGMAPSPFNSTTATQWFSAPSSGTVSYTFGAGGLMNGATAMIINKASFYAASSMYQNGVMSGRLFDTSLSSTNCPAGTATGTVCEPKAPVVYYTWSTGTGQWNQSLWLTNGGAIVPFDPPQNIAYTVPSGVAYGTWAGKTIQLQFNGFGNLNGIPGYCVDPANNGVVDCSTANARYVPMFSIPDAATMTLGTTPLIVKALDTEIRLKDLGTQSASACSGMTLTPLTPPSGGVHDMSNPADAYYIGVEPTVTAKPKVVDGVVQY